MPPAGQHPRPFPWNAILSALIGILMVLTMSLYTLLTNRLEEMRINLENLRTDLRLHETGLPYHAGVPQLVQSMQQASEDRTTAELRLLRTEVNARLDKIADKLDAQVLKMQLSK